MRSVRKEKSLDMTLAKRWGLIWFLTLFCLVSCEASGTRNRRNAFLTEDGQLTAELTLRDYQYGTPGEGQEWTIDRDGTLNVTKVVAEKVLKPARKEGQLAKEELVTLAGVLAAQDFHKLPADVRSGSGANPRKFTITFGEKTSALILGSGQDIPKDTPRGGEQTSPQARFSAVVQTIQNIVENVKSEQGGKE